MEQTNNKKNGQDKIRIITYHRYKSSKTEKPKINIPFRQFELEERKQTSDNNN